MAAVASGSKYFSVNFVPTGVNTSADIFIEWAVVLEAAGWTPIDRSDGTTVTTSGTSSTYAQLNNANAWQRFRAPAGTFEIEWQRGAADWNWRCFFDPDGFNNNGVPATMPTASGTQFQIVGTAGGYDGGWGWQSTGASSYRWAMCADSVPGQTGFYYFHMFGRRAGTGANHRRFFFSPLETGSFPVEDVAPWVATNEVTSAALAAGAVWQSFFKKGLTGAAKAQALVASNMQDYPSNGIVNPYNGDHEFVRICPYDSSGADEQNKGAALDLFWPASTLAALPDIDTLNLTSVWGAVAGGDPGALIRYDALLVPWLTNVAPVV